VIVYTNSSPTIRNNTIHGQSWGISVEELGGGEIIGNLIQKTDIGIGVASKIDECLPPHYGKDLTPSNVTIKDNQVFYTHTWGIDIDFFNSATIKNNTILHTTHYYPGEIREAGIFIHGGGGYVYIEDNNISYNDKGIYAKDGSDAIVTSNELWNNTKGIELDKANPSITENHFNLSGTAGIYAISSDPIIDENNFKNDPTRTGGFGIYLEHSSNSTVVSNNTITDQVYSIYMRYSSPLVNNNTIFPNDGWPTVDNSVGIAVYSGSHATITNNTLKGGDRGIGVEFDSFATVKSNWIYNTIYYGIFLRNISTDGNAYIGYNNVSNNDVGINAKGVVNATIIHNEINNNTKGINLDNASNIVINQNHFNYSIFAGIYSQYSNSTIKENNFTNDKTRTGGFGIYLEYSGNITEIITNNITNHVYCIYLVESSPFIHNNTIYPNDGWPSVDNSIGIAVYSHSNATITNNTIIGGDRGIGVEFNSSATLVNNTINGTKNYGIFLRYTHNVTIRYNWVGTDGIAMTQNVGIYLNNSSANLIIFNNISENNIGIYVDNCSSNNSIHHNNFWDNGDQAFDYNRSNKWDNDYILPLDLDEDGGNFWNVFSASCPDSTNDGICDIPYIIPPLIPRAASDRYPLKYPAKTP